MMPLRLWEAGEIVGIMQAIIKLATYRIEKRARAFAAYVYVMAEDLGDVVNPYLKSCYMW
jgi:hypothetical protein